MIAIATILTLVQKESPFVAINYKNIGQYLDKLTDNSQPKWGLMTAQHLIEHLEMSLKIAVGDCPSFEIITPKEDLEKVREMIFDHKKIPRNRKHHKK